MYPRDSWYRPAVSPQRLFLSSPRKRGPIRRVVAMGHSRRTTAHAGAMGPRLPGDASREAVRDGDIREAVLSIERIGLETTPHPFPCSRARNCSLPFHLSRTLSAYSAETVLTLGNSSFQANGRTA